MAKRRPSGDGMVRKREDGRWEGRIVVGHKENGDSIFRYVYADTQKELTGKLRQHIDLYQGVDLTEQSRMTLGEWLDRWLEDIAGTIRPNTMTRYQGTVDRHIKPYLGDKPISQVKGKDIQRLYETLAKRGNRNTGEGLSSGTVRGIHSMLHEALGAAQQASIIPRNPTEEIEAPKFSYKPKKVLTDEQLEKFMEIIQKDAVWYDLFYTELTTGLRRGELLALQWTDLDVENRTLAVTKQVNRINGELVVSPPKTRNSVRTLALPQQAVDLLIAEHKKHPRNPYLFPSPKTGTMYDPDAFRRTHDKILKAIGAEHIRFHDLRHTFATLSLKSGVDVKTLSGALGHYSAGFTLNTYTHATAQMKQDAADTIGGVISQQMR